MYKIFTYINPFIIGAGPPSLFCQMVYIGGDPYEVKGQAKWDRARVITHSGTLVLCRHVRPSVEVECYSLMLTKPKSNNKRSSIGILTAYKPTTAIIDSLVNCPRRIIHKY